jgi:hypothetical protein
MTLYLLKLLVSAAMIVAVSEVSKRYPGWGGLLASLPLTSLIGLLWIYGETRDLEKVSAHCISVFWFVLPSLPMFLLIPLLLKYRVPFLLALLLGCLLTLVLYVFMAKLLRGWNIALGRIPCTWHWVPCLPGLACRSIGWGHGVDP